MDIAYLQKEYGLEHLRFTFAEQEDAPFGFRVQKNGNDVRCIVKKPFLKYRAFATVVERQKEEDFEVEQTSSFRHLGYLIDVARDAVPTLETLKKHALHLALSGFDQIFWYLEDVFEIENEPYFGYLRGRYSKEELKEFDRYCSELGLEVVPAIQTLAHLNAIFQWPTYGAINDAADILLSGDPMTYQLIGKMLDTVKECFRSKTVHVGMDEAHLVGRGRYLDKNGYHPAFEVLYSHLLKVMEMTEERGLHPQMWSDMFFRIAFHGAYYDKKGTLPQSIIDKVPAQIDQVYWDYVTEDKTMLKNMFRNHKLLPGKTIFAGGAWKWNGWNPSNRFSMHIAKAQLEASKKAGVDTVILTGWSDDGAEASIYSTLPTLVYYGEYVYGQKTNQRHLDQVARSVFHFQMKDFLEADLTLVEKGEEVQGYSRLNFSNLPKILLYNDILSGAYDGAIASRFSLSSLPAYRKKMRTCAKRNPEYKEMFKTLEALCSCLEIKATLGLRIRDAYQKRDEIALWEIVRKELPLLEKRLDLFISAFYRQWMKENKSNGFEVNANRLGGLKGKVSTVKRLILDYLEGRRERIEELETPLLIMSDDDALGYLLWTNYHKISSVGVH